MRCASQRISLGYRQITRSWLNKTSDAIQYVPAVHAVPVPACISWTTATFFESIRRNNVFFLNRNKEYRIVAVIRCRWRRKHRIVFINIDDWLIVAVSISNTLVFTVQNGVQNGAFPFSLSLSQYHIASENKHILFPLRSSPVLISYSILALFAVGALVQEVFYCNASHSSQVKRRRKRQPFFPRWCYYQSYPSFLGYCCVAEEILSVRQCSHLPMQRQKV